MKITAKLKKLSDVFIDIAKVTFITFVISHFISPNVISLNTANIAGAASIAVFAIAIIIIPEEEKK